MSRNLRTKIALITLLQAALWGNVHAQTLGEGGIAGGRQSDAKASPLARAESFDLENSIVPHFYRLRQVDEIIKKLPENLQAPVQEAFEQREQEWQDHRKLLTDATAFEREQILNAQGTAIQKKLYRQIHPEVARKLSDEEKNQVYVEYARLEIESERAFADKIIEIVPPAIQPTFLKDFTSKGHQFLVSPLGAEYLSLSDQQAAEVKKRFSRYTAEVSDRLREARKKNPTGKLTPESLDTDHQLLKLKMMIFSALERKQLEKYLRLKGTLTPNGTLEEWIDQLPAAERPIVKSYLTEKWLATK